MSTITDNFCVKGRVFATDENNAVVSMTNNLIVTRGKEMIADHMVNGSVAVVGWMAVGTGAAAPVVGDSTLGTEVFRKALLTSTTVGNVVIEEAFFDAGEGTANLAEAGLFNAAGSGDMLARANIGPYNKGASDKLTVRWEITVG